MNKLISGLRESWWMFFDTFWALVIGFILSGVVQAVVTRKQMSELLGDHRTPTIARASFFGMVSSSCSYAASALAHSIFKKGADFTASMVFMFASTNLVIELGLVLWLLLGWQFALAEFIGGAVMIILVKLILPIVINSSSLAHVRSEAHEQVEEFESRETASLRSKASASAGFTIGDFAMLRVELVIGFLVAGLATEIVPLSFWRALFLSGHGFWSALENAVIAPFLALISFVCSVGNVPLAAALWNSGITFGGVIAFIFADLVSLPLVLIYRKYYGSRVALKLLAAFWFIMSACGLITEAIFLVLHRIPGHHSAMMNGKHFGWNATTILNIVSVLMLVATYYFYKNPPQDEVSEFAQDPICGMQVRKSDAPAQWDFEGETYYFCMQGCKDAFVEQKTGAQNR